MLYNDYQINISYIIISYSILTYHMHLMGTYRIYKSRSPQVYVVSSFPYLFQCCYRQSSRKLILYYLVYMAVAVNDDVYFPIRYFSYHFNSN